MDKKSVEMVNNDNRSELIGKVEIKEQKKRRATKKSSVTNDLEKTMAFDTVNILKNSKVKKHSEEEKRSELAGKVASKRVKSKEEKEIKNNSKIKSRKIRINNVSMEETIEDKNQENVENISLAMIAMVILFSVVLFGVVGYMLYKIALTNSDSMALIFKVFGL